MPQYKLSEHTKRCIRGEDTVAPVLDTFLKHEPILPRPLFERRKQIMSELREVLAYHRSADSITARAASHIVDRKAADITKSLITKRANNIIEATAGKRGE